jgi:hypothetical protein
MSLTTPTLGSDVAKPRLSRREAAKTSVIASGNAQAVLRRLNEVEEEREANLDRWAWELLQNARDAAGTEACVNVAIRFDGKNLTFEHDGPPFHDEEIAHLIYHGSTKHSGIGRFGTGFISTHLLSRVVRIRGPLDDGTVFDFDLDRTGVDADTLKISMDRSWDAMNASVRRAREDPYDTKTVFTYPISTETSPVVMHGLDELTRYTPFILAFNPQFSSLLIATTGNVTTYRVWERPAEHGGLYTILIGDDAGSRVGRILVSEKGDVQVAIGTAECNGLSTLLPAPGMSRMYVAFPLSNTAQYPFPAATNSVKFHPRTERDGIYLESDGSPKSVENRERFLLACDAFGPLVEHALRHDAADVAHLLVLSLPTGLESVNLEWLNETVKTRVVEDLVVRPVVCANDGTYRFPSNAIIPFAEPDKRQALWGLFESLTDFNPMLPQEAAVDAWNEILASWLRFSDTSPVSVDYLWQVEDLVRHVATCRTVAALANRIKGDVWEWLSALVHYLDDDKRSSFYDQYEILPNQQGTLCLGKSLFRDDNVSDDLKQIAENLGLAGGNELLATQLSDTAYARSLKPRTTDDLLRGNVDALTEVTPENRAAALDLFRFIVKARCRSWLDQVPVVTASETLRTAKVVLGLAPRLRLLIPPSRWKHSMGAFADIFPAEFILHEQYVDLLSEDDWTWLVEQTAVITSPLVAESAHVEDFIDANATDSAKGSSRSKEKVTRSNIAHLGGDDSVLERVRSSRRLGVLLMKFFVEAVIPHDPSAFLDQEVVCEDEEPRRCYSAAWIAQLLGRSWIRHEKKSQSVSAESLALLLADEPTTIKTLLDEKSAPFLHSMRISPADLALRTVGNSDEDRISLIRSLKVIVGAVGNDAASVARLAATIQNDAAVLDYIQNREAYVERMQRNQSFGFAVEGAFRSIFTPETGIEITRTGHGHDFSLSAVAGEEDDGGRIAVTVGDRKVYVELKATRGPGPVHMSVRQVETATITSGAYWLCVVVLPDGEVTSDAVREHARFVCDIATQLEAAWSQYEELREVTLETLTRGDTGLEVTGQEVKFRVGYSVWSTGMPFDQAMAKVRRLACRPCE